MATPLVVRYPLDPTGNNPNNKIIGEQHTLVNRNVRAIALRYGAFFAESVIIIDNVVNKPLTKAQYVCDQLYELPSTEYGKEVYALLLITDTTVSNDVSITYQAVGGPYSASVEAIIAQIELLNLDARPVAWPNIIGKPAEYNPAHHLHDIGDTYGWEYIVHAINRVRDAIMMGDSASHDSILSYIDRTRDAINAKLNSNDAAFQAHVADYTNSHRVTAEQVGAYTKAVVDQMFAMRDQSISNLVIHMQDRNNPHGTTAAQVGAYSKAEVDTIVSNGSNALNAALQEHIDDKGNPHNTTASQVGAYTKSEVDSRLSGTNTALNDHIANMNNPHGLTAAQINLGNVANYSVATNAEALAGAADRYLTPANLVHGLSNHGHDDAYVTKAAGVNGSIITDSTGYTYVWENGAWRTLRSPTHNWDNLESLVIAIINRKFSFEY